MFFEELKKLHRVFSAWYRCKTVNERRREEFCSWRKARDITNGHGGLEHTITMAHDAGRRHLLRSLEHVSPCTGHTSVLVVFTLACALDVLSLPAGDFMFV